jgi:hypothetical protein
MEFATPSQMFFWDMVVLLFSAFSSLHLIVGMSVIARERYLFLLEWSFSSNGNFLTLPASNPEFFICFDSMAYWERDFSFLSKLGSVRYYGPCFFFVCSSFLYYCNILEEEREAGKNQSCRKERMRDGNSTLQFNVNEHLFYLHMNFSCPVNILFKVPHRACSKRVTSSQSFLYIQF